MSGHEQDTDIRDSTPNSTGPARAAGGMGVSSERVGRTGPGQYGTDGVKDTSPSTLPADTPPEQSPSGGEDADADLDTADRLRSSAEVRPEGIAPASGYPSLDPRSKDKPYKDAQ